MAGGFGEQLPAAVPNDLQGRKELESDGTASTSAGVNSNGMGTGERSFSHPVRRTEQLHRPKGIMVDLPPLSCWQWTALPEQPLNGQRGSASAEV